jgi:hypothetical protein
MGGSVKVITRINDVAYQIQWHPRAKMIVLLVHCNVCKVLYTRYSVHQHIHIDIHIS